MKTLDALLVRFLRVVTHARAAGEEETFQRKDRGPTHRHRQATDRP
jgi:hypothetical protein